MLVYFPALYPDELAYSALARYHRHAGGGSPKRSLDDLFGNRSVRAGVALQAGLGALAARLPPARSLSPERLARDTTLLPYLTAFQPDEVRVWALSAITQGQAKAVNVRLGLAAGTVRLPAALRYCPACRAEMLACHGELYWRRDHQLPGVLVCPAHGEPVVDSTILPPLLGQHDFVAANEENCPAGPESPAWYSDRKARRLLEKIASASAGLLHSPPPARPIDDWGQHYRAALAVRGLGRGTAQIDQAALLDAYLVQFGPVLGILSDAEPDRWLTGIVRKHRKAVAPLHHVLIDLLLNALPLTPGQTRPFGCGPWPCRNPLADHRGQTVITDCSVHRESGRTIGVFRCSCGYAFSQAAEAGSRMRILDLGPLFDTRLRDLVSTSASLRSVARALAVDAKTVLRRARRLGLAVPWKLSPDRRTMPSLDRDAIRTVWSATYAEAPGLLRKQLRARLPAEYAWLYRHDRAWLDAQPPRASRGAFSVQRRDWSRADAATAVELRHAAVLLQGAAPPVPVTRAALQRALGRPNWVGRRRLKLPLSMVALTELAERVETFQRRRVAWAAAELRQQDQSVRVWRVRRLAGLSDHCAVPVEIALQAAEDSAR